MKCPSDVHIFEHLFPSDGTVWEGYGPLSKIISLVEVSQKKVGLLSQSYFLLCLTPIYHDI